MNRTKKQETVESLSRRLAGSKNLYVTDFTGVAVKPMTELRRRLKRAGGEYVVVKNTLALRALKDASVDGLTEVLEGPSGFVFAGADPISAAKILAEFQKEHQVLAVKAGLVEGRPVGPAEVERLARLPPKDQLMAELAGALQAPLAGLAGALTMFLYQFVGALEGLRAERGSS